MSRLVGSDLDFNSIARIINLPDATLDQHPVTFAQLKAAVEGLAWKDSVRVAGQSNINLAAPGATIDGITMVANDRFLAPSQSTGSQNGIYIWNGAATPATRALDASTFAELEQAVVTVEEGTSAGTSYRQTVVNGTIDSTSPSFSTFGTTAPAASETVAGIAELATQGEADAGTDDARIITPLKLATSVWAKKKYAVAFGDGAATQYTITHNLNSRDVVVSVYRNSGAYDQVICDVEHTTVNTLTLRFAAAPSSNQFRVVVVA